MVNEALDARVLKGIGEGKPEPLRTLPGGALNAGYSEIRCWIVVAGAIEGMEMH